MRFGGRSAGASDTRRVVATSSVGALALGVEHGAGVVLLRSGKRGEELPDSQRLLLLLSHLCAWCACDRLAVGHLLLPSCTYLRPYTAR